MGSLPEILMASNGISTPQLIVFDQNPQWQAAPAYAVGLIVTVSPGASLTYSVQITGDQKPSSAGYWNDHADFSGLTTSQNGNIGYAATAYRVVVTNYVSGTVHLGVGRWP